MKPHRIIISIFLLSFMTGSVFAANGDTGNIDMIGSLQNIISKYEETIRALQEENSLLRKDIESIKKSLNPSTIDMKIIPAVVKPTSTGTTAPSQATPAPVQNIKASNVEKYNILIDKIDSMSGKIFDDNNLPVASTIGLFEFIEPSNFFISIDDLNNPEGVTAFKRKILYSYDKDYVLKVDGVFELDYASQYYITKFGKNPFAKAKRIRVKNPYYKGKLLDEAANIVPSSSNASKSTAPAAAVKNTTSSPTVSGNVTFEMIKAAYTKNKVIEALTLSNSFIVKDPNNIEVLKIRYRSYHLLGRFKEALAEIQKIESIIGSDKLEKIVACDAKTLAKLLKDSVANKRYADICSSKR